MTDQQGMARSLERIEQLIQTLESAADPAVRASAVELMRSVMDLHGTGLRRIMGLVNQHGTVARSIEDAFVADPIVNGLLCLYDLHPIDIQERVRGALEKSRPYLNSHGGDVELIGIDEMGRVLLKMEGSCKGCPSSAVTLKLAIEDAIREAAPDVTDIKVESASPDEVLGREPFANEGVAWEMVEDASEIVPGEVFAFSARGSDMLICQVNESLFAYASRCPSCMNPLIDVTLTGRELRCETCGQRFDLVRAGRGVDSPELHLNPHPLLVENGQIRVAVATSRAPASAA